MVPYIHQLHLFLYTIFDNFKPCPKCCQPHERHPPEFLTFIRRFTLNRFALVMGVLEAPAPAAGKGASTGVGATCLAGARRNANL